MMSHSPHQKRTNSYFKVWLQQPHSWIICNLLHCREQTYSPKWQILHHRTMKQCLSIKYRPIFKVYCFPFLLLSPAHWALQLIVNKVEEVFEKTPANWIFMWILLFYLSDISFTQFYNQNNTHKVIKHIYLNISYLNIKN